LRETATEATPSSLCELIRILQTLEHAPVAIAVVARPGHRFVFANAEYREAFGEGGKPVVGRTVREVFPEIADEAEARIERVYATGERVFFRQHETPLAAGATYWDFENAPYRGESGDIEAVVITARNVTDHVRATQRAATLAAEAMRHAAAAWESEQRFRIMAEAVPAILFTITPDGRCDFINRRFTECTGMEPAEALGPGWTVALHPADAEQNAERWRLAVARGEPFENECRLRRADGSYCWFMVRSLPIRREDGTIIKWVGSCTDIDELKRLNEALQKTAKQKDVLLREVNHRIKNNLQLIASLLSLQSRTVPEPARQRFAEAIERIHAVAQVYQRLYQAAEANERVEFGPYLREFCASLADTLSSSERTVRLSVDAAEVELPTNQVIPLGLIINELVTNAFKYAYADGTGGTVCVQSRCEPEGWLRITVIDDGIGLPAGFRPETSATVGMKVVRALTKQLRGRFELVPTERGATFQVRVPIRRGGPSSA